jgi:SAM-dependent methyltransferase
VKNERSAEYYDELETRLSAPFSERMIELAKLTPGMRVLDVAAGRGEPALRIARKVGSSGSVLGVDLAEARLAIARARATTEGLHNTRFVVGDAESVDSFGADFDVVTSRWGLMYVASPVKALDAIARALSPNGVFVAAMWADPERVAWWSLPRRVTAKYAPMPPFDPEKPGACRFGTKERIERDFSLAGLSVTHIEEHEVPIVEGPDASVVVDWVRAVMTSFAEAVPEKDRPAWEGDLLREAESYRRGDRIVVGGTSLLVVASCYRRP